MKITQWYLGQNRIFHHFWWWHSYLKEWFHLHHSKPSVKWAKLANDPLSSNGCSSAVQARAVLVLGSKFPSFIIFLPEKIIEPPSNVQVMFQWYFSQFYLIFTPFGPYLSNCRHKILLFYAFLLHFPIVFHHIDYTKKESWKNINPVQNCSILNGDSFFT